MTDRLTRLLNERPFLLADGATGTNLFAMGLETGDAPELWNHDHPDRIAALHRQFVDAGADIILTNTFGGTRHRLKLHQSESRVAELNQAAARIAREVAEEAGREVVVAGSMGPTGELFEPLGELNMESGVSAFTEQAQGLASGGADVLWIETMSSVEEMEAAIAGAAVTGLPVVCTASFDTHGSTMMGVTPTRLAMLCRGIIPAPIAFGANCGVGAAELVACVLKLATAVGPIDVMVAKANCGIPEFVDGAIRYTGTPELMADYACLARDAGARIIGGCCGTTPEHLRVMREALDRHPPGATDVDTVVARLGEISSGARSQHDVNGAGAPAQPRRGKRRSRQRGPDASRNS